MAPPNLHITPNVGAIPVMFFCALRQRHVLGCGSSIEKVSDSRLKTNFLAWV
jgi:hypothetical protein